MLKANSIGVYIPITKANVLDRVSQHDIMKKYLGIEPTTGVLYTNPLREDNRPGCSFWVSSTGKLYFTDFARGSKLDCFSVVQEKFGIGFYEALRKINEDFGLRLGTNNPSSKSVSFQSEQVIEKKEVNLLPIIDDWSESTLSYWKQFGISKTTLDKYMVFPVKLVYKNQSPYMRSYQSDPIFVYLYPPSKKLKIYRPLTTDAINKWRSTTTKEDIDGYYQLPEKGDILIITSSRKDVMCLHGMGYNAISTPSESTLIDESIYKELSERFEHIFVMMDNDKAGHRCMDNYLRKYPCYPLWIPDNKPKDISDCYTELGMWKTKRLLKKMISKSMKEIDIIF